MERRGFLRTAVIGGSAAALGGSLWRDAALAGPVTAPVPAPGTAPVPIPDPGIDDPAPEAGSPAAGDPAQPGPGPYGALGAADANGIALPAGFASRVIARSGQRVTGTSYSWHSAPDGGACFADGDGWIYVSNAEIDPSGGASAVRFDPSGAITGAYRILSNTRQNCAGGQTPWNTWLSCEEVSRGWVYETDPWGVAPAVRRDAMGRFKHEAAAADPVRRVIYLTEDESNGCFYRFVPTVWGDLSSGVLQVLTAGSATSGSFTWTTVPDPDGSPTVTRSQVSGAKKFSGGEGCYYADDRVWFTTKGDNRVWRLNLSDGTYALAYDDSLVSGDAPLTGVDNVTGSASGDLFVAEDGGNMEICVITPEGEVAPFLRIGGQSASEITGPAFSPDGTRLYFSSQRGTSGSSSGGITYEVTGPFRV
ncbi:alkaline phosphatase PhoX [Streptomyces katsurahamanus]|uniref:alkaline phosphatase PhoX n=1 Tax=Streptomyces katsurahamanus TaxID=2577098 RepID=UPI002B20665C|nr:alkaline phosphatase PhoX [Streptomyces katsurahamanus]